MSLRFSQKVFRRRFWRPVIWCLTVSVVIVSGTLLSLIDFKTSLFVAENLTTEETTAMLPPFPIGVNPHNKTITEIPEVTTYMEHYVASNHLAPTFADSWVDRLALKLSNFDWYQNLASPGTRILVIQSGERREEIIQNFAAILRWDDAAIAVFNEQLRSEVPLLPDGKLYPGKYVVAADASPESVAIAIAERFDAEVRTRYSDDIEQVVPLTTALIVASLIEREAYDFDDMRYISGIIWNRLFTNMKLQIDATLQYSRGTASVAAGGKWWPVPKPADKFIVSPFNTYQHTGLPPTPISNPSIDAIIAALNPRETDCLFYYHTNDGTFYCNKTYEDHVAGIAKHLK